MKKFLKILAFTLLLGFGSFFLANDGVSAKENNSTNSKVEVSSASSIQGTAYVEIPIGSIFPPRIWQQRGDYGGYLTLVSYEKTRNNTYKGLYRGKLVKYAAPHSIDPEEEEE